MESSSKVSCPARNEVEKGWYVIWSSLMRSLPAFVNITLIECASLNDRLLVVIPAASYALSVGSAPSINESRGDSLLLYVFEAMEEWAKEEEQSLENLHGFFECSVDVLARIDNDSGLKVNPSEKYQHIHLPQELRDQLLHEMENHVLECMIYKEIENMMLSELLSLCALLSNFMYCSYATRNREAISPFFSKLGKVIVGLLDQCILVVEKTFNDITSRCSGTNSFFDHLCLECAKRKVKPLWNCILESFSLLRDF